MEQFKIDFPVCDKASIILEFSEHVRKDMKDILEQSQFIFKKNNRNIISVPIALFLYYNIPQYTRGYYGTKYNQTF